MQGQDGHKAGDNRFANPPKPVLIDILQSLYHYLIRQYVVSASQQLMQGRKIRNKDEEFTYNGGLVE
jgi:hypothetical protein